MEHVSRGGAGPNIWSLVLVIRGERKPARETAPANPLTIPKVVEREDSFGPDIRLDSEPIGAGRPQANKGLSDRGARRPGRAGHVAVFLNRRLFGRGEKHKHCFCCLELRFGPVSS